MREKITIFLKKTQVIFTFVPPLPIKLQTRHNIKNLRVEKMPEKKIQIHPEYKIIKNLYFMKC